MAGGQEAARAVHRQRAGRACCSRSAAALLYARVKQRPFARAEIARAPVRRGAPAEPERRHRRRRRTIRASPISAVIIHPYFGYVVDPARRASTAYGFFGPEPLATRSPDVALIAVFGGSVADQLAKTSAATR